MKNIIVDLNIKDKRWESQEIFDDYESVILDIVIEIFSVLEIGFLKKSRVEVSVVLTNNQELQKLNKGYLGKDRPTNVLSFSVFEGEIQKEILNKPHLLLGDIFISLDLLQSEAEEQGKLIQDYFKHLITHSFLHLLGYDHCDDERAEHMENLEIKVLNRLGVANPYKN